MTTWSGSNIHVAKSEAEGIPGKKKKALTDVLYNIALERLERVERRVGNRSRESVEESVKALLYFSAFMSQVDSCTQKGCIHEYYT